MVFVLLASGNMLGHAEDKVPGIIIELANGEKVEYRLVDKPTVVYDGTKISLTAEGVSVDYEPTDLKKLSLGEVENVSNGINELQQEQGNIQMEGGFVRLSGFAANEAVYVYNMAGVLTQTHHTSASGSLVIPVSSLPSGISIIKANKQTIKITKR